MNDEKNFISDALILTEFDPRLQVYAPLIMWCMIRIFRGVLELECNIVFPNATKYTQNYGSIRKKPFYCYSYN